MFHSAAMVVIHWSNENKRRILSERHSPFPLKGLSTVMEESPARPVVFGAFEIFNNLMLFFRFFITTRHSSLAHDCVLRECFPEVVNRNDSANWLHQLCFTLQLQKSELIRLSLSVKLHKMASGYF